MVWRLLFIGLLGAALAMPMAVVAQSADPFQWDRREFAGQSVRTRPRPELDPLGIRVGSFRFYPILEIGGRYEDNVFRSPSNEKGDLVLEGLVAKDLTTEKRLLTVSTFADEVRTHGDLSVTLLTKVCLYRVLSEDPKAAGVLISFGAVAASIPASTA